MEKRGRLDAVLGLGPDWRITRVERTPERKELRVELATAGGGRLRCPHCGEACPVREHLWGIVNAVISGATNGPAEGINSRIKRGAE